MTVDCCWQIRRSMLIVHFINVRNRKSQSAIATLNTDSLTVSLTIFEQKPLSQQVQETLS